MAEAKQIDLTTLTVELLGAYVANNSVASEEIAGLIQSTHAALAAINAPAPAEPAAPTYVPAVSTRKSLASREHIISMIDGKPYKTLKRHLSTHGLSPAEYRQRYNLPADYPMVAAGYSEQRRAVAERLGLGRRPAKQETPAPAAVESAPEAPAKSGRSTLKIASNKPRAAAKPAAPKPAEPKKRGPGRKAAAEAAPINAKASEKPARKPRRGKDAEAPAAEAAAAPTE